MLAEFRGKEAALVAALKELVEHLRNNHEGAWLRTLEPALADLQALTSERAPRSSKAQIGSAIRSINRGINDDIADDVVADLWTRVWDLTWVYQEAKYSTID